MRKFAFTLKSLLNVKISLEKQKTIELSDQNRRILLLEGELEALRARLRASTDEFNAKMEHGGGMRSGIAAAYSSGFRALHDRIIEQIEKIRRAVIVRERIMAELTELMGERKMLEKLREKQYQEYLEEVRREEAKIIDDYMSTKIIGDMQDG